MPPLHVLRTLKLFFLFSIAVSCVQILLYRTIVLNAKHAFESRFPLQPGNIEVRVQDVSEEKYSGGELKVEREIQTTTTSHVEAQPKACSLYGEMSQHYPLAQTPSDMSDWTTSKRAECPQLNVKQERKTRLKLIFVCNKMEVFANLVHTNETNDVFQVRPDDKCLSLLVSQCCTGALPVPNVVHYVWFEKRNLSFFEFVSFMSTIRFVRPCVILIHGDSLPEGKFWDYILSIFPNIVHVERKVPNFLFGKSVKYKEHIVDAWRIKSLIKFGGIYMSTDTFLVKSIDQLRRFSCTISKHPESKAISPAIVMAERNVTFLQDMLQWFKIHYDSEKYTYSPMTDPQFFSNPLPGNVHVEKGTLSRPRGQEGNVIFTTNTNWSNIYGMHLNSKTYPITELIETSNIRYLNTTVGALCRHILFGNKEICAY